MARILAILLAAAAAATTADAAWAQGAPCGPRDSIVRTLDGKYDERRIGVGLQPGRGVVEIFTSESGSWTLLLTLPSGATCIMAAGEAWSDEPEDVEAAGDPV